MEPLSFFEKLFTKKGGKYTDTKCLCFSMCVNNKPIPFQIGREYPRRVGQGRGVNGARVQSLSTYSPLKAPQSSQVLRDSYTRGTGDDQFPRPTLGNVPVTSSSHARKCSAKG